jgi:acyl carrier protein
MAEATLMISMYQDSQPVVIDDVDATALGQGQVRSASQHSRNVVGCGNGFFDQQVLIVDPNTKRVCEPHQIGELWLSGPSVCMGYWNNSEATNETFGVQLSGEGGQRFLCTGDLAYIRDGTVFITGRLKDLIIIRGRNHYPQDIEYTVQDCWRGFYSERGAAFSIEGGGEEKLVVVQEVGRVYRDKIDGEKIGRLAANAIAKEHELQLHALAVVRPTSIPLTSSGKIQRQLTKRMWLTGELDVLATWQITNSVELESDTHPRLGADAFGPGFQAWLRYELATQFKVPAESIPLNESFAYLGLDSLIATTVANKLGELVGSKVEPNCLYDYPTINSLSAWLTSQFGQAEKSPNSPVTNTMGLHMLDPDRIEKMTDEEARMILQEI